MTKFVGDGQRVNLDRVRKIEFYKDGACEITWGNGEEERLSGWIVESLKRKTEANGDLEVIVPAAPGWTLITFLDPDGEDVETFDILSACCFDPVIAWKVCLDQGGGASQVAISVNQLSGGWTAVQKDGQDAVYDGSGRYDNLFAWIKQVRGEWKRRAAE